MSGLWAEQFAASIASEAVEVREDDLLFREIPVTTFCPRQQCARHGQDVARLRLSDIAPEFVDEQHAGRYTQRVVRQLFQFLLGL